MTWGPTLPFFRWRYVGELTKADVLGVEADESDSEDDEEQQQEEGQQPVKQDKHHQQEELLGTHAAAAAAKAASAKLVALLSDSVDGDGVGAVVVVSNDGGSKSLKSGRSRR